MHNTLYGIEAHYSDNNHDLGSPQFLQYHPCNIGM